MKDKRMIQSFSCQIAHESFAKRICLSRPVRRFDYLDTGRSGQSGKLGTVFIRSRGMMNNPQLAPLSSFGEDLESGAC